MVFEPLVLNNDKGIAPYLAQRWEISPDGKSYTFFGAKTLHLVMANLLMRKR